MLEVTSFLSLLDPQLEYSPSMISALCLRRGFGGLPAPSPKSSHAHFRLGSLTPRRSSHPRSPSSRFSYFERLSFPSFHPTRLPSLPSTSSASPVTHRWRCDSRSQSPALGFPSSPILFPLKCRCMQLLICEVLDGVLSVVGPNPYVFSHLQPLPGFSVSVPDLLHREVKLGRCDGRLFVDRFVDPDR